MKKALVTTVVLLTILMFAVIASATTFTFSQDELYEMVETFDDPDGIGTIYATITQPSEAVYFYGAIADGDIQWRTIHIGYDAGSVPSSAQDLSGYDNYALTFTNVNNQDWWLNLYMNTPSGFYQNGWICLSPGIMGTVVLDFAAEGVMDLNNVTEIGFQLAFNDSTTTPLGQYQGDTFHLIVQPGSVPVPEPGTLYLLGFGLLGLGILTRKRS